MNKENIINSLKLSLEKREIEKKYIKNKYSDELGLLSTEKEALIDQAEVIKGNDDDKYLNLSLQLQEVEDKVKKLKKQEEEELNKVYSSIRNSLIACYEGLKDYYSKSIEDKKLELKNVKKLITENNRKNDFAKVMDLANEASKIVEEIEENKLLINKIEELANNAVNCEFDELEAMGKGILEGTFDVIEGTVQPVVDPVQTEKEQIARIREIIEKVENGELILLDEDIIKLKDEVLKLNDSAEKDELLERVNRFFIKPNSVKGPVEEFKELYCNLTQKFENRERITREEIVILKDLYNSLDEENLKLYKEKVLLLISYYNLSVHEKEIENYDETKISKYGKIAFVTEFLGVFVNKIMSSKVVNKIRTKKIEKNIKKAKNGKLSDKKLKRLRNKTIKVSDNLNESTLVSGVKLFSARNKIASMKPVLFKEGINNLDENQKIKFERTRGKIDAILSKGIEKKMKDNVLYQSNGMMENILKQYVEMLSISEDFEEVYKEALEKLAKFKETLSESLYNAYKEQFYLIYNYRKYSAGEIYNHTEEEIENIKEYVDSEEYKKPATIKSYIK